MKKNVLLKSVKYDKGGIFSTEASSGLSSGAGAVGSIGAGLIDTLDPQDAYGVRSGVGAAGSGALKGAMAGAALGPAGMIGGAVIGGLTGILGNKKAKAEKNRIKAENNAAEQKAMQDSINNKIAQDPTLVTGRKDAQMYKMGGTIKGKPSGKFSLGKSVGLVNVMPDLMPDISVNPAKMVKVAGGGEPVKKQFTQEDRDYWNGFVDYVDKKGYKGSTELDKKDLGLSKKLFEEYSGGTKKYEEFVPSAQGAMSQYREESLKQIRSGAVAYKGKEEDFMPGLSTVDGWAGSKTTSWKFPVNKIKGTTKENTVYNKMAKGGKIKPTSSTTAEVKGPSHANGGVKLPSLNIEVEGDETLTSDGFVFSKDLGIAEMHNKVAKAMGKNEKRPLTPLVKSTAEALKRKEGFLKIHQEEIKREKGLPNEIDNTAQDMFSAERSGPVKMQDGGQTYKIVNGKKVPVFEVKAPELVKAVTKKPSITEGFHPLKEVTISAKRSPKPVPTIAPPKIVIGNPEDNAPIAPEKVSRTFEQMAKVTEEGTDKVRSSDIATTGDIPSSSGNATASKGAKGNKLGKLAESIAPFASNIANAFRKLPKPAAPKLDSEVSADLISLDAEREEAKRMRRGADKSADQSLNSNTAAAVKATNLSQQMRESNKINETETNINTQIKNQTRILKTHIKAGNTAKVNNYNNELVSREIKQQELNADNLADVGNKIQAISRDKKLMDLEDTKQMITVLGDDTGATWRAGEAIFKRSLSPEMYSQVKDIMAKREAATAEERAAYTQQLKEIANQIKSSSGDKGKPTELVRNSTSALVADYKLNKDKNKK